MIKRGWLVSPPYISIVLWWTFLVALWRYEVTYPWYLSTLTSPDDNPIAERGFRDIIVRPELRTFVCSVLTVQILLTVLGELVELWFSPQRLIEGIIAALLLAGPYLLVLMSLKYDPINHVAANNTCFGGAILLFDFQSFVSVPLYWCGTEFEQADEAGIYFMQIFWMLFAMGVWGASGCMRIAEWMVVGVWVVPYMIKARLLYLLVYQPDLEFRRRTWRKIKPAHSGNEEATRLLRKRPLESCSYLVCNLTVSVSDRDDADPACICCILCGHTASLSRTTKLVVPLDATSG